VALVFMHDFVKLCYYRDITSGFLRSNVCWGPWYSWEHESKVLCASADIRA